MAWVDGAAILLLLFAVVAFCFGGAALSRSADLEAFYWFGVGVVALRGAVALAKPGHA